jgi:hypothetical protein
LSTCTKYLRGVNLLASLDKARCVLPSSASREEGAASPARLWAVSRNQHRHTQTRPGRPTLARRAPSDRLTPATLLQGPLRDCFPTPSEGSAISLGANCSWRDWGERGIPRRWQPDRTKNSPRRRCVLNHLAAVSEAPEGYSFGAHCAVPYTRAIQGEEV